jgi:hypothetical protein
MRCSVAVQSLYDMTSMRSRGGGDGGGQDGLNITWRKSFGVSGAPPDRRAAATRSQEADLGNLDKRLCRQIITNLTKDGVTPKVNLERMVCREGPSAFISKKCRGFGISKITSQPKERFITTMYFTCHN